MTEQEKEKTKKMVITGLGVGALGALGFFGWKEYKKWRERKEEEQSSSSNEPIQPNRRGSYQNIFPVMQPRPKGNDEFPLKKGSRGEKVKQVQEALITLIGKDIFDKAGADGVFGKATITALQKAGYPSEIDESTFHVIVKSGSFDPSATGWQLHKAAEAKNLSEVLAGLKKLKTVEDYAAVNEVFKKYRLHGIRYSLVNGLLRFFPKESDKQLIRIQFIRMGLKYNGNTWTLSGIGSPTLITVTSALIWKNSHTPIKVPAKTVLGYPITRRKGYTLFQSFNNEKFLVKTSSVKQHERH